MDEKVDVEITGEQDVTVMTFTTASISNVELIAGISKRISEFIEKNQPNKIVIDFGGVKFFSSQVLGLLLDVRAKLQVYAGEVVLSAINPQLYRVFKITRLDKIFRFFPDRKSAIETVGAN